MLPITILSYQRKLSEKFVFLFCFLAAIIWGAVDYTTNKKEILTEVIDQGMGIDAKFHDKIFEPFIMTSNIPTDNESKTGLGLAIAKKIVELHLGSIAFTSEKGKGSDFYFTLPVQ